MKDNKVSLVEYLESVENKISKLLKDVSDKTNLVVSGINVTKVYEYGTDDINYYSQLELTNKKRYED